MKHFDVYLPITARGIEADSLEDAERIIELALDDMASRLPGAAFVTFDLSESVAREVSQ